MPDDVYIRNESETVRTQQAVTDVAVGVLGSGGASTDSSPTERGCPPPARWSTAACGSR